MPDEQPTDDNRRRFARREIAATAVWVAVLLAGGVVMVLVTAR